MRDRRVSAVSMWRRSRMSGVHSQGDRGDHAIDEAPGCDALGPARPVEACCTLEVGHGFGRYPCERCEKSTKLYPAVVASSAGEYLHEHRFRDRDVGLCCDQLGKPLIDRRARGAVVLDPRGRFHEDHEGALSGGMSRIARAPRMSSASAVVIGRPARWRRARSTASVFVWTP